MPGIIGFTICTVFEFVVLFKWLNDESKAKGLLPNTVYNNKSEDLRFLDEEIINELNL